MEGRDVGVQLAVWLLMGDRDSPVLERHEHATPRTGRDIDDVRVPLYDDPDKALIWALREAAGLDENTPDSVAAVVVGDYVAPAHRERS